MSIIEQQMQDQIEGALDEQFALACVSGSNCSKCVFFRYEASWGHGWCYNDNSQYSGKLRGNGPSCNLDTSKR